MTTNSAESELARFREATYDRFQRLMPANDLTLIILKGHLLVEEQMNKFIEASLGEAGDAFSKLNLPFSRKLRFARELHRPKEAFASTWSLVKELNDLRNDIAHNPETPNLDQQCTDFVEKCSPEPTDLGPDVASRLLKTIGNIVACVAGLRFGREIMMGTR
jgi:hypothetical protein